MKCALDNVDPMLGPLPAWSPGISQGRRTRESHQPTMRKVPVHSVDGDLEVS